MIQHGHQQKTIAELTGTAILAGNPAAGQPRTVTAQQVVERHNVRNRFTGFARRTG
jgi:hypothetical protein